MIQDSVIFVNIPTIYAYNTATSSTQLYVYSLIPTENNDVYKTKIEQTYNLYKDQLISFTNILDGK